MGIPVDESEAYLALSAVQRRRQQVLAEIGVPAWYWFFLALGWAGLGVLSDFGPSWAVTAGTAVFGALHATLAPRVITGRRGSSQLSIRGDLVSRELPAMIIGFLVLMIGVTVAIALLLHADGTRHPGTFAGAIVALLVVTGGPSLIAAARRRAERG